MRHHFKKTFLPILFSGLAVIPSQAQQLLGFGADAAKKELDLEATFDKQLQANNLRDWMKRLTAFPHQLGSAYGLDNALFLRDKLASWGFEARLDTVHVLFPTPKVRLLELTEPTNSRLR